MAFLSLSVRSSYKYNAVFPLFTVHRRIFLSLAAISETDELAAANVNVTTGIPYFRRAARLVALALPGFDQLYVRIRTYSYSTSVLLVIRTRYVHVSCT